MEPRGRTGECGEDQKTSTAKTHGRPARHEEPSLRRSVLHGFASIAAWKDGSVAPAPDPAAVTSPPDPAGALIKTVLESDTHGEAFRGLAVASCDDP